MRVHAWRVWLVALLPTATGAQSPPAAASVESAPPGPCDALRAFAPVLSKTLPPSALCRPEPRDAACLPGFVLQIDFSGDADRCVDAFKQARGRPRCAGLFAQRYKQTRIPQREVIGRNPGGGTTTTLLQWPGTVYGGEEETLPVREPLPVKGPDPCIYVRVEQIPVAR